MRLVLLWLIIGSFVLISGVALLTNVIDVSAQQIGIFDILCVDIGGCQSDVLPITSLVSSSEEPQVNANPWGIQTDEPTPELLDGSDESQINNDYVTTDDLITFLDDPNLKNGNQGCSVSFWVENEQGSAGGVLVWPSGYLPQDKFGSSAYFNTQITISSGNDPSFTDALNSQNDGIDKLARQSVAALLNAAHPDVSYPLTIAQVISMTDDAIAKSDYSVADTFATYNNLGNSGLCP
jgi:hypothetical protein